ncbi:NAD+ synthetase [Metamycoplasma cloacale]|uniref:NH(3)-dependent NAD(+) synthetase n=1 Tax=Metamycoplasma cloacale TaxID=92401 RepID=A0A2Z4LM59_9BACT|nr:NAD(+) synthase [Metamycoplasma cloacale]AWX42829.1 NAD(+) synthase [Metamycoplasma cloacale]VEU79352.1 NAD+ synthetase [Metamycoplasma cloacale]
MNKINDYINKELNKKEIKIYSILIKKITNWLQQKVKSANAKGLSLGISGGIDSATLAKIALLAFPNNCNFYYFKTKDDIQTEKDIEALKKSLNVDIKTIDLSDIFNNLKNQLDIKNLASLSNLKSRLFMSSIYALSQDKNHLVLGTDNYNEYYLGYFTKYGDGGCDLLPFANIKKSDIYILAKMLDIPNSILTKSPSANLCIESNDEEELGFSYLEFEKYLINKNNVSKEIANRIEHLHKISEHKRNLIPKGPKLK